MGEKVIVVQNARFETLILALDPHHPESHEFQQVHDMRHLTPYGMLLGGLGSCTATVLHTYAQHHDLPLEKVTLYLKYDRTFEEDCKNCEAIQAYSERIAESVLLEGPLTPPERKKLFTISKQCPIHKILAQGITIDSELEQQAPDT